MISNSWSLNMSLPIMQPKRIDPSPTPNEGKWAQQSAGFDWIHPGVTDNLYHPARGRMRL